MALLAPSANEHTPPPPPNPSLLRATGHHFNIQEKILHQMSCRSVASNHPKSVHSLRDGPSADSSNIHGTRGPVDEPPEMRRMVKKKK